MIYGGTSISTFYFSKSKYLLRINSVNTLIHLLYIEVSSRNKKDLEVYASIYHRNADDATRVSSKRTIQQNMTDVDPLKLSWRQRSYVKNQIAPANKIKIIFLQSHCPNRHFGICRFLLIGNSKPENSHHHVDSFSVYSFVGNVAVRQHQTTLDMTIRNRSFVNCCDNYKVWLC